MSFNGSLATWMSEQRGLLSLQQIAIIVRKTADALQLIHEQRTVHNDVNPTTILMRLDETRSDAVDIRLSDLGTTTRPSTRYVRGFPANSQPIYMAPEQWSGRPIAATDQYALAVLTYELFTGIPPFQGPPARLMDAHLNVQPSAPSSLHKRILPAHDAVILAALSKRPEDRFPSALAFACALEQAIQHPESSIVNVPSMTTDGSLRATLLVSMAEAALGTLRTITLPQGRRMTVAIPEGATDGQIIKVENANSASLADGSGVVFLTIEVGQTDVQLPTVRFPQPMPGPSDNITGQTTGVNPRPEWQTAANTPVISVSRPTMPFITTMLQNPRTVASNLYSSYTSLPPRRQRITLFSVVAGLMLVLILGSVGVFALASTSGASTPYTPNSGTLALSDMLRDNTKGSNWPDGVSSDGGTCQFMQGTYHVSMTQPGSFHYCVAGSTGFGNLAYEANMTIIKGDEGGLVFRADGNNGKFYYYRIGRDGSYGLYLYGAAAGSHPQTLTSGLTPAVHTGLNIANVLAVVARNGTIDLYVNKQHIATVNNSAYGYGQIGVASGNAGDLTEVVFNNARVWTF
ncbi:MAG: hypothetical protein NVS4B11_10230 [Ktedonobacteraceae bacterium]